MDGMEKPEMDKALDNVSTTPAVKEVETVKLVPPPRTSQARKRVTFNERVDIQWPEASRRIRFEASKKIAKRKAEQEQKIVALVNRSSEKNFRNIVEDPDNPNFPFPADYKRIDFDHLDPYKLYRAAEFLRHEQERFIQPFETHRQKIRDLEDWAETIIKKEEMKINRSPQLSSPKKVKPLPPISVYEISPYRIDRLKRIDSTTHYSKSTILFAKMNNPGGKAVSKPGYYPKPPTTFITPKPRPDTLAMRNVANWVKSNFQIKPVPLILHQPRLSQSVAGFAPPQPSIASDASFMSVAMMNEIFSPPPLRAHEQRELHIINGVIRPPNSFTGTVGNSFDENYDASPFKDVLGNPLFWAPHHYRYIIEMRGFQDNEITVFYKRPFITIQGKCSQTRRKAGRRAEETFEIPDVVLLKNLKFYRLGDGKIVIEETAYRKPPTSSSPDPTDPFIIALRNYYPHSSSP